MSCATLISEHVATYVGNDGPAASGRFLWWLCNTQRGEDLVHYPRKTIMEATKCSIPSCVDLSVYRHGVSIVVSISFFMVMRPPFF